MCPTPKIKHPFICKKCKVPVISRSDTRAILGKEHAKWCPRYLTRFHPNTRVKK
jgi:hypothetical protein